MVDIHESLWSAINELPKPCDKVGVLASAKASLSTNEYAEFKNWFDDNWAKLLIMINGN